MSRVQISDRISKYIIAVQDAMVVAVRLVEVLATVTVVGIITVVAAILVLFERFLWVFLLLIKPFVWILDIFLCVLEYIFLVLIDGLIVLTERITNSFWAEHPFQWLYDVRDTLRGRTAETCLCRSGQ